MNAEQNSPESHAAVAPPPPPSSQDLEGGSSTENPGSASSKSRRRRRKRKNRTTGPAGAEGSVTAEAGAAPQAEAGSPVPEGTQSFHAPRPQRAAQNNAAQNNGGQSNGAQNGSQNNGNGGQQMNGTGQGKRWKKKKFGRGGDSNGGGGSSSQPRPEPGNSLQGSNSGQRGRNRKQQSRGPRSFVGPMDHSYRETNGNYADVPASTIDMSAGSGHRRTNNHHRNHGNEDRMPPELLTNFRAVAIAEDAPTHIYFFIEDLFFTAKIQEAARQQGVKVAFMKPDKDIVAHLAELPDHEHPSLIVFDLNNVAAKPLTLIPKLKSKLKTGTSIVGFLSHLQGELKAKAMEAGCNSVMPRAAFSQNLPNLLRRYGAEDEHEQNFNQ